jgi:hypothetical protein
MSVANVDTIFHSLGRTSIVPSLVTFLLIFTILFAVLQKTEILGKGKKRYNTIVALCIALMPVVHHAMTCGFGYNLNCNSMINMLARVMPNISVVVIGIVMALLIIGLFGGQAKWGGNTVSGWIALVAFILIGYLFYIETEWGRRHHISNWLRFWGPETTSLIVIILVFAIIIWFITKDDEEESAKDKTNLIKDFGELFKK